MCETNAYVGEELYMDNVDIVRLEEGRVYLKNLFGQEKLFKGSIREISLAKHRIVLEAGQ